MQIAGVSSKIRNDRNCSYVPGQQISLQDCLSISVPLQEFPPYFASFLIVLVRVFSPPSHALEQVLHSPNSFHSQCSEMINKSHSHTY